MGMQPLLVDVEAPVQIANWRPLVHWLLAIPQLILASVLRTVGQALTLISFFAILFTGRIPDGIYRFQAMQLRYNWRAVSYLFFLREAYPPFTFEMELDDPGDDPAVLTLAEQGELNRWLPLVKWLLLVPHFIALFVLVLVQGLVMFIAFFVVLFTGRWPEGMRSFVVGVNRWGFRVTAYLYLLYDEYPPFSLD
jgi:uncharacterized protein DUF4389